MSPKGFWSYARGDDDHLDGVLTELRGRIAGEVSMLLGQDVGIFQDIYDLRTGDRWAETLRTGVTEASFLIPVLTPRFFNRPWCCEEVLTFLRIAKNKGLEPRIFPVRFVEFDADDDCEVRAALVPFQYKDLSQWRFESDPTQKAKLLNEFAKDVKARLKIEQKPRPAQKVAVVAVDGEVAHVPAGKLLDAKKYKTYVVDLFPGRGDFTSIGAAIEAAEPGSKIVVREGTYRESVRLSKPLEILGEGHRERILIVTARGDALHCDAPMARISGMRFRRESGGNDFGIWITGGAVEIDDCVVESLSMSCVGITMPGTSPTLRRCVLRDSASGGLQIGGGSQPVVEDCEISGSKAMGMSVEGMATRVTMRRCISRGGESSGYHFSEGAGGLMERCEANGNSSFGLTISTGADPILRECTLRLNGSAGVAVYKTGQGMLVECLIEANIGCGLAVSEGGSLKMTRCIVKSNGYKAVWIRDAASSGEFRGNDLRGNTRGAWGIAEGATLERADNIE